MNISINSSKLPFTVTFQRRIWMQYILEIARTPERYNDDTLDGIDLIRRIQIELIGSVEEELGQLLSVDITKFQFGILTIVSSGYRITNKDKYSKIFDESCEYLIHAHKLFI